MQKVMNQFWDYLFSLNNDLMSIIIAMNIFLIGCIITFSNNVLLRAVFFFITVELGLSMMSYMLKRIKISLEEDCKACENERKQNENH